MGNLYTSKKIFSLVLAVLVSGGIIFSAFNYNKFSNKKTIAEEQVLSSEDWLNSLKIITTSATSTIATVERGLMGVDTATSTTEKIGRDLLMEYALSQNSKSGSGISNLEVESITNTLIAKAQTATPNPYTIKDIRITTDSSQSFAIYSEALNPLLTNFYKGYVMNESVFVAKALADRDPTALAPLAPRIERYKKLETDLIALKAPKSISQEHFELLHAYASARIAIEGMYNLFSDPIQGLNALSQYNLALKELLTISEKYKNIKMPQM